jgi:YVTN family beta-propeller protein
VLGRGGMGVVYLAEDRRLKRKVALKLLAPQLAEDERFGERLLAESELAASLDHPNIVPIYEAGEADGRIFISMRYVAGQNLRQLLKDGPLPPDKALALVSQVASALDAAHARGLVHRDVKPSNVLIAPTAGHEGADHVYLADFGLSRRLSEVAAGEGRSLGTVDYVAPEQIRGEEIDGRADLYSLGCLLYECLAGRPPFERFSDTQVLFAHLEDEPPVLPDLDSVLSKALAKSPDDRFQSGRELVEAAREALGLAAPPHRRLLVGLAASGMVLLASAAIVFFITRGGGAAPAEPGADSLVRIDPGTNEVSATMPVGRTATGVAADARYVWVTNAGDDSVWRIDTKSSNVLKLPTQGTPTGVAVGDGAAVVADGPDHRLVSFDAATGTLNAVQTLHGGSDQTLQIAAGGKGVWFADPANRIVDRFDVLSASLPNLQVEIPPDVQSLLTAYRTLEGVTVGRGAVWVEGDPFGREVWRVDPEGARVVATIRLPFVPKAIAAGEGAVWVTSLLDDSVARIDPRSNRIVSMIRVGRGPDAIATGAGGVWVTSAIDDTISRIDPATNRVVATIPVHGSPSRIAVGGGRVWVTVGRTTPAPPAGGIKIGILSDCTGPIGGFGNVTNTAAKLPLIERGGKKTGPASTDGIGGVSIAGRPVQLFFGCGDSTPAGNLVQARRLVEAVGVDILIGPWDANEALVLLDYARRHPAIAFVNGASGEQLLHPPPNFFSFYPDAAQQMAGLGAYAYHTLGWRKAVTITDDYLYDWTQQAGFIAEFCSLGGRVAKRIFIPPGATDLSWLSGQIPKGVDGIVVSQFTAAAVLALADSWQPVRRNLGRKILMSTYLTIDSSLDKLAARGYGLVNASPVDSGYSPDDFATPPGLSLDGKYMREAGKALPQLLAYFGSGDVAYYNSMTASLEALDRVHGDLSGGERRFMAALAKVVLNAPDGRISLDSAHRPVAPNYLFEYSKPAPGSGKGHNLSPRLLRTIPNVEPTFGGYFKTTDPPPSTTTPACVKRTPPVWARSSS